MPLNREQKDTEHRFTTITTDNGVYELWNSLTSEEEQIVIEQLGLEKGGLPLSKKDKETQRLLFGQGAFGKVRLAHKAGHFSAVKKIKLGMLNEADELLRELHFGKLLKEMQIPHVAYITDGGLSVDKRGQETMYLFMDKIASLGDGHNLKKLLSYFDSKEQREAILIHTAHSLLEAVAHMHQHQIYHRDIKASNVLVSSAGQVYVSDFGSALTTNYPMIANILNEHTSDYAVSSVSDMRYLSPEFRSAIYFKRTLPATEHGTDPSEILDNWRVGLTLLQLCGVIKENEGLLARQRDETNKNGTITPGWVDELNRRGNGAVPRDIEAYFETEIEKIKKDSMHKIPVELRKVIFGLLEIDSRKRLTAADAFKLLKETTSVNPSLLDAGFKNLVHNQISETLKSNVKRALKAAAERTGGLWFDDAWLDFRYLIKQPDTTFESIKKFLDHWILEEYQPSITEEQCKVTVSLVQQKHRPKLSSNFVPEEEGVKEATLSKAPDRSHYLDIDKVLKEVREQKRIPELEIADPEFNRLQNDFKRSANRLLEYIKTKVNAHSPYFKKLETRTLKGLNFIIQGFKKFISKEDLEITRVESRLRGGPIDESAVKAVFARVHQILGQLTLGKLMHLSKQEITAVYRMLEKDKDFLESIADKIPGKMAQSNPLQQIDEKIQLIERLADNHHIYVSTEKLGTDQFLNFDRQAEMYCAKSTESDVKYIFSEFKHIKAYQLPPSISNEQFRNFVAHQTVQNKKAKEIYLYTSSEVLGSSIANMIALLDKNTNLKIYVNDQLLPKKVQSKTMFSRFFKEDQTAKIVEQAGEFTIDRLSAEEVLFKK